MSLDDDLYGGNEYVVGEWFFRLPLVVGVEIGEHVGREDDVLGGVGVVAQLPVGQEVLLHRLIHTWTLHCLLALLYLAKHLPCRHYGANSLISSSASLISASLGLRLMPIKSSLHSSMSTCDFS